MRNANKLMLILWMLFSLLATAQVPPPITRSVLTTNIPAFGSAGQALFRISVPPYLNWSNVVASGGLSISDSNNIINLASNYTYAVSNYAYTASNSLAGQIVTASNAVLNASSNYTFAVSNLVVASTNGTFIEKLNGTGTNTTFRQSSANSVPLVVIPLTGSISNSFEIKSTNSSIMVFVDSNNILNSLLPIYSGGLYVSNSPFITYRSNASGLNTIVGTDAGTNTTTGYANTFIGEQAGLKNIGGSANTYLGRFAGQYASNSSFNTFIGVNSGVGIAAVGITGERNTFLGYHTGQYISSGANNTYLGNQAGEIGTNASDNVFVGYNSGVINVSGNQNVMIGSQAGQASTSTGNIYIGYLAGFSTTSGDANTFVGWEAGYNNTSVDNTFIGSKAGFKNANGNLNTFVGYQAGANNNAGCDNVFIGSLTGTAADSNVFKTFLCGSPNHGITNVFFGEGTTDSTPISFTINATGGSGTDIAGANVSLAGGKGTGTGAGGEVRFLTASAGAASGTGTNVLSQRAVITSDGAMGIGTNSPLATIHIRSGPTNQYVFQADASNNLALATVTTNGVLTVKSNVFIGTQMLAQQPIGLYGSMMMNATNMNAYGSAYTNVSGYNVAITNGFFANLTTGDITNTVAGYYRCTISISFAGVNAHLYEGCLLTNGVDPETIAWRGQFDTPARMRSQTGTGLIYLPAGTRCHFAIKDETGAGDVAINRASIVIGTP